MPICATCHRDVPDDSRFCPHCAAPIPSAPAIPTMTSPPKPAEASYHSGFGSSSSDSIDDARFTPGTMLADRYRIVGLLGKGGMGEVYRADDLKLRQPVALKFLPEALSVDPKKLERFLHEVRVARQVSHPNVCRVYDISEADGQHFISMEYVDGEDLLAVLRRMGRPSKEKALQIARQLCAGLAAAHDKGVLHRDLKPHNVMIDGQGRVRITDFGLAGFAEDFTGKEVYAGTPAYMSPEQLAGRGVSVKSDIYSLGVVLSELFTGKRLFEGTSREQLQRSGTSAPTRLSTLTDDIDPAVERVILRCLEPNPIARPSSALAVAAALPGGDPLAAALAAGETPDPAMVAAGGEVGGLRPGLAVPCLLAFLIGIAALGWLNDRTSLFRLVPLPKTPDALADRAADLLKKVGHETSVADIAYGFGTDSDYLDYIEEHDSSPSRWAKLNSSRPAAIYFWHRESPTIMVPPDSEHQVISLEQPPLSVAGMTSVLLDPAGRLRSLKIVPPEHDDSPRPAEGRSTEWSVLFAEAGLDFAAFARVDPVWNPTVYCDERAAWQGAHPTDPNVTLRVEAGAYRGKPSFFQVIGPWVKTPRMELGPEKPRERVAGILFFVVVLSAVTGSCFMAGRNIRLKRGDRSGAFRIALFVVAANMLHWVLEAKHVPDPWTEFGQFEGGMRWSMFAAGQIWIVYLAFEPYVRRRWPQVLISWTRLLAGRLRDPLVGTDILVGALLGVTILLLRGAQNLLPSWLESARSASPHFAFEPLLGGRYLIAELLNLSSIFPAFLLLFILFALRTVLRKQALAVVAFLMLFTVLWSLDVPSASHGAGLYAYVLLVALITGVRLVLLMRFGLLATTAAYFFAGILGRFPITLDFSTWYAGTTLTATLTAVAVAAYSFHTALAGRPIFKDALLEA